MRLLRSRRLPPVNSTLGSMKRSLCLAVAACILSGCAVVPWPHMANTTPKVRGAIQSEGKPGAELQVRVAAGDAGDPCGGRGVESVTGRGGEFEIEPARELRLLMVVMAHTYYPWSLCRREGTRWVALVSEREYSLADTGPIGTKVARCELAAAAAPRCQVVSAEN